jgi:hypothetical protein
MAGLLDEFVKLGGQGARVTQEQWGTIAPLVKGFFQHFTDFGAPVRKAPVEANQLRLPLESRQRGRFVSPTRVTNPADVTRSMQPRMVDLPNAPARVPAGQQTIPGMATIPGTATMQRSSALAPGGPQAPVPSWVPQSEAAQQLLTTDPGTYRSIQDIANKASDAYGIPANEVFDNLVGPRGIDYLRALEYGEPGALMRQGSSAMTRGGSGGGATGGLARMSDQGPGSMVRSPGGSVTDPVIERVRIEDITRGGAMTPAQESSLSSLASRPLASADSVTPMGTRNAVGGTRQADLSGLYKAATGLTGIWGLGFLLNQMGQEESLLGPTTANPEVGPKIPAVTGGQPAAQMPAPLATPELPNTANPPAPETFEPALQRVAMPQPGMAGGGQVVIRTNDGESNYRQARANAESQGAGRLKTGAAGMYAVERAAAMKEGQPAATIEALRGMGAPTSIGIEEDAAFQAWAQANPVLAYRLMEQRRTMPSQQMPVMKQTEITSEAGTNVGNLVEGSVKMGMEDPAGRFQGSSDLRQFMAPRSAAYIGNVPVNMYR